VQLPISQKTGSKARKRVEKSIQMHINFARYYEKFEGLVAVKSNFAPRKAVFIG
jgi:hypothetical protein